MKKVVFVDGACKANPNGPAESRVLFEGKKDYLNWHLGIHSNNYAELFAILMAIRIATGMREDVDIYSDSQCALGWAKNGVGEKSEIIDKESIVKMANEIQWLLSNSVNKIQLLFWDKKKEGREIPADFGRK